MVLYHLEAQASCPLWGAHRLLAFGAAFWLLSGSELEPLPMTKLITLS